jgi:hypothetical protein
MRADSCWERLDDVVSELYSLHEVDEDAIVARVRAAMAPDESVPNRDASRIA